ncbi:MAG: major capsid protein [Microviridae sp.]|nr:MAG: major capsid protein [Microviridae sp.]
MITKTLGGDRLGAGHKMNVELHGYERSTHDLSRSWRSTMACGTLVPFFNEISLNGDTWDIDLATMLRTVPTVAPLFGSFKLQLDMFSVPIRLYNASLHMNRMGVGLDMSQIYLPKMYIMAKGDKVPDTFDPSSLIAYLGVRGAPQIVNNNNEALQNEAFTKQALSLLAYWSIYKNYYSNKQEKIGYQISNTLYNTYEITTLFQRENITDSYIPIPFDPTGKFTTPIQDPVIEIDINFTGNINVNALRMAIYSPEIDRYETIFMYQKGQFYKYSDTEFRFQFFQKTDFWLLGMEPIKTVTTSAGSIMLKPFQLVGIDETELAILKTDKKTPFALGENSYQPYVNCLGSKTTNLILPNYFSQNGLGVKTYQSDIFNNWLNTEWIDGDNGINAISSVDTSGGKFTMDTLNLAKKVYDMLNRVAVSGGSYQDWQEAIWGEKVFNMAESPIYCGGMSTEVIFEEVISTADSTNSAGGHVALGSLAGRGTQGKSQKGGHITIKTSEPSIILGIVSITPRIDYSQGTKWFTRLKTMNDFHKPALNGIGFQELITETMAHWDAKYEPTKEQYNYKSAGKQPAWIDYMTSYNETYGNFAIPGGHANSLMQMTLNRQYEYDETAKSIKDLTSYIDPTKYNYAFAQTNLEAQNFWVQIGISATARRKMSAKIIPNL